VSSFGVFDFCFFLIVSENAKKKGLGNDFNESLMTSISEAGGGTFCYIAQPKLINEYVGDALGSLMLLIGTNAKLEVRGVGTGVVKKIYDHTSNTADLKVFIFFFFFFLSENSSSISTGSSPKEHGPGGLRARGLMIKRALLFVLFILFVRFLLRTQLQLVPRRNGLFRSMIPRPRRRKS
jgi:hypothetical protein